MNSLLDIINLLKKYGTYIYTLDREGDLMLMEDEIKEMYKANVMDIKDFQMALLVLRQEAAKLRRGER